MSHSNIEIGAQIANSIGDQGDNQELFLLKGVTFPNNVNGYSEIKLDFASFNFTEEHVELCRSSCDSDIGVFFENPSLQTKFFGRVFTNSFNFRLLNMFKLKYLGKRSLSNTIKLKLKRYETFEYETEILALAEYFQKVSEKESEIIDEYFFQDYVALKKYFEKKSKMNVQKAVSYLSAKRSLYALAKEQKMILNTNLDLVLKQIESQVLSNLGELKRNML